VRAQAHRGSLYERGVAAGVAYPYGARMHRPTAALIALLLIPAAPAVAKPNKHVCGAVPAGSARCHARVVTDAKGDPAVTPAPNGYGPADLQAAYQLPSTSGGSGQQIAIVDAYDDPNAAADLATYRSTYGLSACGSGCFTKVNQNGSTTGLPKANGGWAQEISLDLDMASAVCPNCKILLVEASSSSFANLAAAEDTAARLGATVISNSYGGNEFNGEASATYDGHFSHPGIPITVSSGDSGYGVEFPAASQYVTAVGGTSLTKSGSSYSEKAWSGAGSGCSAYIAKPSWQTDTGCARRTVADVSAVADPNTGVAVYDSYRYQGRAGWMVFGGTSVAAPVVASVYALAGNAAAPSYPYAHAGSLTDVTSGSNGSCSVAYLCTSGPGFDGPTGLGTPIGAAAF
jgi:subtilase family serine protease